MAGAEQNGSQDGTMGRWKVSVLRSCGVERLKPEGVYSRRPKSLLTLTSACSLLISGGPEWVSAWPSEGKLTVGEDAEWLGVIDTPWTICIKGMLVPSIFLFFVFALISFCASQDCFVLQKLTSGLLRLKCDSLMQRGDLHGWRFYQALMPKAGGCGILEEEPRGLPFVWLWFATFCNRWIPALEAEDRRPQFLIVVPCRMQVPSWNATRWTGCPHRNWSAGCLC